MKTPEFVQFGFIPNTAQFRALLRDCSLPQFKQKFEALEKLSARALRAEIGPAERLINPVFRSPAFIKRCRSGFDLGSFLQKCGKLIVERGDENEDVNRTIMGGINMLVTEHCETRAHPHPPVRIYLDECTNARTAGNFEERKAGETRKYGLSWCFLCQWPNFPNGPEGFYQNCGRKEIYRTGHYDLARKLAAMAAAGYSSGADSTHAAKVAELAAAIVKFQPGERLVTDRTGSRIERVQMLENPWPDWPGADGSPSLREAKLQERLQWIYARPEYGGPDTPPSSSSSIDTPQQPSNLPEGSLVAQRWKRAGKKRRDGSSDSVDGDEFT